MSISNAYVYIAIAMSYLAVSTPLFFTIYYQPILAWEHVLDFLGLIFLLIHVRIKRDINTVSQGLSIIAVPTLILLVATGGIENSGIYFITPGVALIYFISRRHASLFWMTVLGLGCALMLPLKLIGLPIAPYPILAYILYLFGYALAVLLLYLSAKHRDKLDLQVFQKNQQLRQEIRRSNILAEELADQKTNVEQKVIERTRELTEAQAQLISSVRSLPFGFAVIDTQDHILFSNRLLSQLINRPIPDDAEGSKQALREFAQDYLTSINVLQHIHDAQAKRRPIEKNIAFGPRFYRFFFMPILLNEKAKSRAIGTALVMEDTTEEKAIQRSRDEFFSIASHELRTPLTAIRGNARLILDFYQKQLKDPDLKSMVTDIHSASLRLIGIVNDFLDMSRLEQGKFIFTNTPIDMRALITDILREFDVTGSRRKLSLELETPTSNPLVLADKDRVRQIVINLIGNAVKYTEQGGVKIRLQPSDKTLQIIVSDTGQGIPLESQHLLFRKFQQASNNILTRDNTRSTGLGLYISQLLATGMRGSLYLAHSEVDKGSTFVFELPKASDSSTK